MCIRTALKHIISQLTSPVMLTSTLKYLTKPHTLRLVTGPAATTLSLFQKHTRSDTERLKEQFLYLRQYSYVDLTSRFKCWVELDHSEQEHFVNDYIRLHESKIVPKSHPHSVRNALKQMMRDNKDVDFMFYYLYEGIKDHAEEQFQTADAEAVIVDDTYDLLIKREDSRLA